MFSSGNTSLFEGVPELSDVPPEVSFGAFSDTQIDGFSSLIIAPLVPIRISTGWKLSASNIMVLALYPVA